VSGTLPAAWIERWAVDPDRRVLWDGARGWVTAAELEEASRRVAGRLQGAGLEPGDRVLFSAGPSIDLVAAHVGALRAGLVTVPVNTAYTEREVAHVVGDARPRAAVVDDLARLAEAEDVVVVGPEVDLPDAEPSVLDSAGPDDLAHLGYTSGTTGSPKGAALSHGNLLANNVALEEAWRWTADDRLVLALPLFHAHGLCNGVHGTLLAGASAVLLPAFDPDAVLDAARDHEATMFFGVPTMYHRFARTPRVAELGGLRLCVSGSAALPADLHRELEAATGSAVLERYGMTETNMLVSNPYEGERRAGTVGFPLPNVEVRLADDGEVEVRGPNVFGGYWERPEASADAFTADGWFRTGDLAEHDPDGYLRILGRSKELIITGGYNVFPREVEEALLAHPGVVDAAVVGAPDDEWGERVCAFVVAEPGVSDDDLVDWCGTRLAAYKRPRRWERVDEVPRNALGKVVRHALVERL
jgi:malonyl-CoA/methylmalonyl-CoA synthetase